MPPLAALGRWACRKVHGNARSAQGFLLTRTRYVDPDQEWRLGQSYIGLLGFPALPVALLYLRLFHSDTGYRVGRYQVLGHWADLPPDLKILIPATFVAHLIFIASAVRLVLLRGALGSREELGE